MELVADRVRRGWGKSQIYRDLIDKEKLDAGGRPSKSTIERLVDTLRPRDTSGPWSFSDSDPAAARLVIDVVAWAFQMTEGRVWLTNELARWVGRIRETSPGVPAGWAYNLAVAYQSAEKRRQDTRILDIVLATKPWDVEAEGSENDEGEHDRRLAFMQWAYKELGPPNMHIDHLVT